MGEIDNFTASFLKAMEKHSEAKIDYLSTNSAVKLRCLRFTPRKAELSIPLVFVPGWISWLGTWRHFLNYLTTRLPVIYLETREKNSAEIIDNPGFALEDIASDISPTISHYQLEPEQYILAGSSLGATAILEALKNLPSKPKCIILMLPNAHFQIPKSIAILKLIPYQWLMPAKRFVQWFMLKFKINPDDADHRQHFISQLNGADVVRLKESAIGLSKYQMDWELLKKIDIPCFVIGAEKDTQHIQDDIFKMHQTIENSEYKDFKTFTNCHSSQAGKAVFRFIKDMQNG